MTSMLSGSTMAETMAGQPEVLRRLVADGWGQAAGAADRLAGARRVVLTGIGTSYHAALVGAWLFRAAGLDARAVLASDLARYPAAVAPPLGPGDAVVVLAHTGVKSDPGAALACATGAGATVVSVGGLTAEHPGSELVLRTVARETSAAYTASHLAAMAVLAQVATVVGERTGVAGTSGFRDGLAALPDAVAGALARADAVAPVAEAAVGARIYATGAGPNAATALELVIKAREAAQAWVDALPLEQFLHGPLVAVNRGDLAVLVHVPGPAAMRTAEVAAVLAAIGARLWVVGDPVAGLSAETEATTFPLPEAAALPEELTPLLTVIPMQLLALRMAEARGLNPDTFRRDDPVYRDALGLIRL